MVEDEVTIVMGEGALVEMWVCLEGGAMVGLKIAISLKEMVDILVFSNVYGRYVIQVEDLNL